MQALKRKRAEVKAWVEYTNMAAKRFQAPRRYTDAVRKVRAAERVAARASPSSIKAVFGTTVST